MTILYTMIRWMIQRCKQNPWWLASWHHNITASCPKQEMMTTMMKNVTTNNNNNQDTWQGAADLLVLLLQKEWLICLGGSIEKKKSIRPMIFEHNCFNVTGMPKQNSKPSNNNHKSRMKKITWSQRIVNPSSIRFFYTL